MGHSSVEYQAVILAAGQGSRMTDVTSSKAKCMLPIGGLPLIYYPLSMLWKIGFREVIVVALESIKQEVSALPAKLGLEGLTLDVATYPTPEEEDEAGTADAIRLVHSKLTANKVMVISGDLITDFAVHHLTDLHALHNASVTALYASQEGRPEPKTIPVPGPKSKFKKEPKELVGIDSDSHQLCLLASEADLDDTLTLRKTVLREHPNIRIHTKLLDAHFYIFDKWVCDFISHDDRFTSVRGEVLPYLVNQQFSKKTLRPFKMEEQAKHETPNSKAVHIDESGISKFINEIDQSHMLAQSHSSWNSRPGDLKPNYRDRVFRCYAYLVDSDRICVRANTMYNLVDLNTKMAERIVPLFVPEGHSNVHPKGKVDPKANLGSECFVGEGSVISEKTTIKNCTIGSNCVIEPKVRLTDSVIMDNVTVKSICNIQGSYICDSALISQNCEIKNSIIGSEIQVEEGQKHINEIVATDNSRMMEI